LPVAAGENLRTLYEFRQLIVAGGVTFPEPDATNCGGVTSFLKICHLAEAFNLPVTSHGAHDLTVHLLAAAPNPRISRRTASASTASSPSRSGSRPGWRSRRTGPVTGSSSTGRRSTPCERAEP